MRDARGISGLILILALTAAASPASAQVIEIGDDGLARTYDGPTKFVAGPEVPEAASRRLIVRVPVDRFEQTAQAEGVDVHLLRAVAWTESRGQSSALSPKGAIGVMQLMPGTAAELKVDPLDPDANLHGGARYLARQLLRFQSVPLALAAYNAGPGAVQRWGGIPPYAETRGYVASIMARWQSGSPPPVRPVTLTPVAAPARAKTMLIEVPSL